LAIHRARERKIVDATRAWFDDCGRQETGIDRIARRVVINKDFRVPALRLRKSCSR
jgi:hypothetical protein